jgi:hypothetical protein
MRLRSYSEPTLRRTDTARPVRRLSGLAEMASDAVVLLDQAGWHTSTKLKVASPTSACFRCRRRCCPWRRSGGRSRRPHGSRCILGTDGSGYDG